MAHVERISVYPVKGIDPVDLETARVLAGGTLEFDREFALFDPEGDVFNAKRSDRFHDLGTAFDPGTRSLTVEAPAACVPGADGDGADSDGDGRSVRRVAFDLDDPDGRERAAGWFSAFFGTELTMERDADLGFVDRRDMGPSVISTATLRELASWFDGMTVEGARRRLRANVEVGGVPAFWEDRFVGADAPGFTAGGIRFDGVTPCGRCVVPERDPDTGEPTPEFRERFLERRRATFPRWADADAFDHYYAVMVITRIADDDHGECLSVGDPVRIVDGPEGGSDAEE